MPDRLTSRVRIHVPGRATLQSIPLRVPVLGAAGSTAAACAGVVAFFLVTRLLLLWRFPPFLDESLYATWASAAHDSVNERFIALANGKLPLLPWLGGAVMELGAEPLTAVRLVSLVCGLFTMAMAGLLGARLGGRWAGVAAAGVYALLPFSLVHDVLGLMEPLVATTGIVALYLQVRLAVQPRLDFALLLGLVFGAGLLTKESGAIPLVLLPASLLVFRWGETGWRRRLAGWFGCVVVSLGLAGVCYSVLTLSEFWDDYGSARASLGTWRSLGTGLSHPLRWLDHAWPGDSDLLVGFVTWPILLLAALGLGLALKARPRLALLYLLWALVPTATAVLFLEETFARYLLPAVPVIALFAGYGAQRLVQERRRLPAVWRPLAATGALVLVSLAALVFDGQILSDPATAPYPGTSRSEYSTGWAAGTGWKPLTRELKRRSAGRQIVVGYYEQFSYALPLLLRHDRQIVFSRGEANATYLVRNGADFPTPAGNGSLRLAWTYHRPDDGVPLDLYERGIRWHDSFYRTRDELRAGLDLPDADFDRFLQEHPSIKAWYDGAAQ
jgi:4-amino-4-deoxy-L-arabinose transferase-like glycosyltransferase